MIMAERLLVMAQVINFRINNKLNIQTEQESLANANVKRATTVHV